MKKQEASFIKTYLDSLDKKDIYFYKIPDNRMTGKKPADVIGWYKNGSGFLWEFKYHTGTEPFNYSHVTELQRQNLKDAKSRGGEAMLILGVGFTLTAAEQWKLKCKAKRINFVIGWDIDEFLELTKKDRSFNIKEAIKERYGK